MPQSKPKEKCIDAKNDTHEQQPPDAPILPSMMACLFVGGKHEIGFVPDDAVSFFLWRRCGEEGRHDHYDHADKPGGEGAMIESVIGIEQMAFVAVRAPIPPKNPTAHEPKHHGSDGSGAVRATPKNAERENYGERRRDEEKHRLDFFEERGVGLLGENDGDPDAGEQNRRAAPAPDSHLRLLGEFAWG